MTELAEGDLDRSRSDSRREPRRPFAGGRSVRADRVAAVGHVDLQRPRDRISRSRLGDLAMVGEIHDDVTVGELEPNGGYVLGRFPE